MRMQRLPTCFTIDAGSIYVLTLNFNISPFLSFGRAFTFNDNFYHHFSGVSHWETPTRLPKQKNRLISRPKSSDSRQPADPSRLRSGQSTHQIWLLCMFPVAATEPR